MDGSKSWVKDSLQQSEMVKDGKYAFKDGILVIIKISLGQIIDTLDLEGECMLKVTWTNLVPM